MWFAGCLRDLFCGVVFFFSQVPVVLLRFVWLSISLCGFWFGLFASMCGFYVYASVLNLYVCLGYSAG